MPKNPRVELQTVTALSQELRVRGIRHTVVSAHVVTAGQASPKMLRLLERSVLELRDLVFTNQLAHWNVRGSRFLELHKFFQEQYELYFGLMDDVAEQIKKLEPSRLIHGTNKSLLVESGNTIGAVTYLLSLQRQLEHLSKIATRIGKIAEARKDYATQDLAGKMLEAYAKSMWMIESISES